MAPPWFGSPPGNFLQFLTPTAAHIRIYSTESFWRTEILKNRAFWVSGFSVVSWLLASWLLGSSGSWLLGFSASIASWLLGLSGSWLFGFGGFLASRLQWLRGSWLLGFGGFLASVASWLLVSGLLGFGGFLACQTQTTSFPGSLHQAKPVQRVTVAEGLNEDHKRPHKYEEPIHKYF